MRAFAENGNEITKISVYHPDPELYQKTDSPITMDEICMELKSTRNNKAAGDDSIRSELYKPIIEDANSNFAKMILKIFNKILEDGTCTEEWESFESPSFQKG